MEYVQHLSVEKFILYLLIILVFAKAFGRLAEKIGQPSVLGELLAGVVLSASVLALVPSTEGMVGYDIFHLLAEIGVVLLLFEIGLETRLADLIKVGPVSALVAVVGVVLPFALGYFCVIYFQKFAILNLEANMVGLVAIVMGATLTATSVGITARVLADLDRLQTKEARIVLTAAIIDDVIGLIILGVVSGIASSFQSGGGTEQLTLSSISFITAKAFGFLAVSIVVGRIVAPRIFGFFARIDRSNLVWIMAIAFCFVYAYCSNLFSLAPIVGAFAAGLVLRETEQFKTIEASIKPVSHFFAPIFFVMVGAAVDVSVFNPFVSENIMVISIALILFAVAVIGKYASGYVVYEKGVRKSIIGIGMIPRGEVGLIFAKIGLAYGVFKTDLFSAVTAMVILTTFIVPPLLKWMFEREDKERKLAESAV
ncbi:MAG: cation:proton antiporter [Candidatus Dadabacteria bacterium]|nr:cation:proton antiporter [Candidatus Dadabacteria bacterium]MDE0519175.1 cation:proton antiporter [Candidatus Dadabacteria bacterium]MDE0663531.1 cation:proton antiporter [Candidatus Dadabacteria bacterium]